MDAIVDILYVQGVKCVVFDHSRKLPECIFFVFEYDDEETSEKVHALAITRVRFQVDKCD